MCSILFQTSGVLKILILGEDYSEARNFSELVKEGEKRHPDLDFLLGGGFKYFSFIFNPTVAILAQDKKTIVPDLLPSLALFVTLPEEK